MRIGSPPDISQRLVLMLAAAQREPALIRRCKHRPLAQKCKEFQHFCDAAGTPAMARGVAEEKLAEILAE